ncbi:hypothetical protein BHM03_00060670, partial [Ensete ventricosum]
MKGGGWDAATIEDDGLQLRLRRGENRGGKVLQLEAAMKRRVRLRAGEEKVAIDDQRRARLGSDGGPVVATVSVGAVRRWQRRFAAAVEEEGRLGLRRARQVVAIFTRCQGDRCVVNRGEALTTVD